MENRFRETVSEYSDEYLLQMLHSPAQWEPELLLAAEDELEQRNLLPEEALIRRQQMIAREEERLSEGKPATFLQQFFGWLGIFGILGLIIGYDLYFSKVKSIYTDRLYDEYDSTSKENGRYIFFVSVITHSLFILFKVLPWIQNRWM